MWLRVLTVIAAIFLITYFYTRPDPLFIAIYWNLLFTSLNIFWIARLLIERRLVHLTGNDLRLYQLVFRCLTPREMKQLLKIGRWEKAEVEECFISAPANVIALEETYYMSWDKQELKNFLKSKTELHMGLQLTLGFDLIKRLEATYVR